MSLENRNANGNANHSHSSPARERVSVLCQSCGGDGYELRPVCCGKSRSEECGGVGCMGAVGERVKCLVCDGTGRVAE
jgi:hypothetical protein